jgi:hypothetical protein
MVSPQQRLRLRLDLGRRTDIQFLTSALDDMSTVCSFGGDLQRVADRNLATYEVLQRPSRYLEDWELFEQDQWYRFFRERGSRYPVVPLLPASLLTESPALNRAVAARLRQTESERDARVVVEELHYSNPVEWIILASGVVLLGVIKLIRDWPDRRELNQMVAANYRSVTRDRERARQIALNQLERGEYRLSRKQIEDLFTDDVADALGALGDARLEIEGPADAEGER